VSISKRWIADVSNRDKTLALYRSPEFPTLVAIAKALGTSHGTISHVLRHYMPEAERKALAKLRYSASKMGDKNPMKGKCGEAHHNWVGLCEDGKGYLTCMHKGKRQLVHRIVMAQALGLMELPEGFEVHHIDGNTRSNELDNLALVTPIGHKTIHFLQVRDYLSIALKRSTIAEIFRSTISQ
jgi:hypothetical protein